MIQKNEIKSDEEKNDKKLIDMIKEIQKNEQNSEYTKKREIKKKIDREKRLMNTVIVEINGKPVKGKMIDGVFKTYQQLDQERKAERLAKQEAKRKASEERRRLKRGY
jgi:hypothetical protein